MALPENIQSTDASGLTATDHNSHHDSLHKRFNDQACTILNKGVGTSISNNTVQAVPWESVRVNDLGLSVGTPRIGLTVLEAGLYLVVVNLGWKDQSGSARSLHLQLNGTLPTLPSLTWTADGSILSAISTGSSKFENARPMIWAGKLSANDVISVFCYQASGSALFVGGSDGSTGFNRPSNASVNSEFCIMRFA